MKAHFARSIMLSLMLATGSLAVTAHAADVSCRIPVRTRSTSTPPTPPPSTASCSTWAPSKAEAIVAYRKEHGSFKSPEQLALVKGIGLKTVEKNRDRILIGGSAVPARQPAAPSPDADPRTTLVAQGRVTGARGGDAR